MHLNRFEIRGREFGVYRDGGCLKVNVVNPQVAEVVFVDKPLEAAQARNLSPRIIAASWAWSGRPMARIWPSR